MIVIIDYGMGNLRSVSRAFETQGFAVKVTNEPADINSAGGLVLPGVGAFGDCLRNLEEKGLIQHIKDFIGSGRPFLGICLGFQALFDYSEESPGVEGLSIYEGEVIRFPDLSAEKLKVPQMGWNQIEFDADIPVLEGIPQKSWFYFVHSYYVRPRSNGLRVVTANYGIDFAAAVQSENVFACQFHPEKSGEMGLRIIKNFARLTI